MRHVHVHRNPRGACSGTGPASSAYSKSILFFCNIVISSSPRWCRPASAKKQKKLDLVPEHAPLGSRWWEQQGGHSSRTLLFPQDTQNSFSSRTHNTLFFARTHPLFPPGHTHFFFFARTHTLFPPGHTTLCLSPEHARTLKVTCSIVMLHRQFSLKRKAPLPLPSYQPNTSAMYHHKHAQALLILNRTDFAANYTSPIQYSGKHTQTRLLTSHHLLMLACAYGISLWT